MGLMSILGLLALPLMKRRTSLAPLSAREVDPSQKTDPLFIAGYDAGLNDGWRGLQTRIDELERELEHVRGDRDYWRSLAHTWRDRADAMQTAQQPFYQVTEEMRQRMMLQALAQQQQAQQLGQHLEAQQAFYVNAQQMHYCNCVPGRTGFLRGDN
jgi:hypothetical protein